VKPVRIGLSGPIGCGKSTVAAILGELGAVVIDADEVARSVSEPGGAAFEPIVARFGVGMLDDGGRIDRARLAAIVFTDPARLAELEAIVHPAVRPLILERLAAASGEGRVAVVEAIKLVEGGLAAVCDETWLVTCRPAAARERLLARGMDPADAERRIAAQADAFAGGQWAWTRVIDTSGSLENTRRAVEESWIAATGNP
jgi:dephospho-CoA kinase